MKFYNIATGEEIEPTDWQLQLAVGDYYINENGVIGFDDELIGHTPNIYGQILEFDEPGYFLVRGYSQWCPEGEIGMFNICEATRKLTPEEFEEARQQDWP